MKRLAWLVVAVVLVAAAYFVYRSVREETRPSSAPIHVHTIPAPLDMNGDLRSDWVVVRPGGETLTWFISNSAGTTVLDFGKRDDVLVPADYDGDGRIDFATWRSGIFWVQRSSDNGVRQQAWGNATDDPNVVGDYDGDGKADYAVFRASGAQAAWMYLKSSDGNTFTEMWGQPGDVPAPADYDGDGRVDPAVVRGAPSTSFFIHGSKGEDVTIPWGLSTDVLGTGDYDGDGRADLAVARTDTSGITYYIRRSSDGAMQTLVWGQPGDIPVPGDYDGDRKTDLAVWRSAAQGSSAFHVRRSSDGTYVIQPWGQSGDRLPGAAPSKTDERR